MDKEQLEAAILAALKERPNGLTIWNLTAEVNESLMSVATCVLDMARRGVLEVDDKGPNSIIIKIKEQ